MADHIYIVDMALSEVPINDRPIVDASTLARKVDLAYNAAGLVLNWNFITPAGAYTQTAVTPTNTGGNYDWVTGEIITIEIPASGGASINNDTEGTGWFTGFATGFLPWKSPIYKFLPAASANALGLGINFVTTADLETGATTAAAVSAKLQADMQADPTDFHVNVMEINGTAQTANDNGADINTILSRIVGTILAGDHNPQSGDGYAIVNNGTYGNSALNTKLNTIAGYIDTEIQSIITHLTDIKGAGWTTQTLQAIITALATKPTVAEVNGACDTAIADAALSSQASVDTIDGIVDSLLIIAQKLDTALELDGVVYKFTVNALEEAPTGVGGFTTDDRTDLQAIDAIAAILATMYENSAGYRWTAKALETAPVTSVAGLATTTHVQEVEDKLDIVDTNVDTVNTRTGTMDTKLDTIDSNVDSVLEDTGSTGVKVMDVETGLTHAHAMQILVALGCLMDGGGTATIHARNYADTKNRITWIVDENGNRTGITFNFD